jgi:hypothetical protein
MAARSTMAELILRLRGLTNAGTADYSLGTANFWDDTHLQEVLDRHRVDVMREVVAPQAKHVGGTVEYHDYYSQFGNLEATNGGTAIFYMEAAAGADIGTANYSVDYQNGVVSFPADQKGSVYYLTGRSFDMNGAAADVWRQKASHFTEHYDFSTDNHSLKRGQVIDNCLKMSSHYAAMARPKIVTLES